jgi:hypothetical protein
MGSLEVSKRLRLKAGNGKLAIWQTFAKFFTRQIYKIFFNTSDAFEAFCTFLKDFVADCLIKSS